MPPTANPAAAIPGSRPGSLPRRPEAQLATLVQEPPTGEDWLHELKYDGYRLLAVVDRGRARLWSRNGNDWTDRFSETARELADSVGGGSAVIDGELVVQQPDGTTSFQLLQNLGARPDAGELLFYAFDLLYVDGLDLRPAALEARKGALLELLESSSRPAGPVRFSDHVVGSGPQFYRQACAAGVEGIVCKRRTAPYRAGRTRDWVKVKCSRQQEFVVVGFTEPAGSRQGLGALVLGVAGPDGLRYSGRVGTGFTAESLRQLRRRLTPLERPTPPLANPPRGPEARGVHWVEPQLVAEVAFTEVTRDGILRHPSFRGLREDKPAGEVVLERPASSRSVRRGGVELMFAGVRLSHPDKVLYPDIGVTKLDLARYYEAVADWIMPHIRARPLTLLRCPQGNQQTCFFQKHMDELDSPHVRKIRVKETRAARDYGTVHDLAGILTVVQLGTLELHTWNSRADRLEYPDRVTIDVDPSPEVGWDGVVETALEIRALLRELELESFVKTTGGKGLHVVLPLLRRSSWDEVREFARALVVRLATARPDRYTVNVSKAQRKGRLLLDYLRNTRGATAIEVYSTRARQGATVSTPVSWHELESGIDPQSFTIRTVPDRLRSRTDPWKDYGAVKQSLTAPLKRRLGLA